MQPRRRHGPDFWLEHFERWKQSGLSQNQYSLGQKISAKTFSRWCGRLKRDGAVDSKRSGTTKAASAFVPLVVGAPPADYAHAGTAFRVALRFRIEGTPLIAEVASGADTTSLADVLTVLLRICK
jgi:hypothetical protein